MKNDMTTLRRDLEAGESVSFDKGRVVITLQEKSGRKARLEIQIQKDIVVDKPRMAINGIFPTNLKQSTGNSKTGAVI